MAELAYVNGVFGPLCDAKVSIEDRGFQFGDGIYEVMVSYNGKLFLIAEHLARLRRSAAAIDLEFDFDAKPLEPIIAEGIQRSGLRDAMIYIQITRGAGPRNHVVPDGLEPTLVMTFKPRPRVPDDLRAGGAKVMTTLDTRWANCYVKAITLLPNVLAKNEAIRKGFSDAIFITASGEVRECTSANVFTVKNQRVLMPPRTQAILHGVTQAFILQCASSRSVAIEERSFDLAALREADEVFMSSTAVEVLGIVQVDAQDIGDGTVGPITQRLHDEFLKRCGAQSPRLASKKAC